MTSTFTLTRVDLFPNTSSVGAYPVTNWTKAERDLGPTGAPKGSATSTQTMTAGTLTFTGLADNTSYYAVGPSPYAYVRFKTGATAGPFLPSAPGTSGQVLTMGSSGYAAWADAASSTPGTGSITSAMILDGEIVNADINASAAIAGTKLATGGVTTTQIADGTIVNADIDAAAAIAGTKLATGGVTTTQIADGTIVNADIDAAAAIVGSKITTGSVAPAVTSVTVSAATTTLDANSKYDNLHNVTLSATSTTLALSNTVAGAGGVIRVIQDATGGRTCTIPAGWKKPGGTGPTLSTAVNAVDVLTWFSPDGTLVYLTGWALALA